MKRKWLFFLLKFVFGFGLLFYLVFFSAKPREIIVVFSHAFWPMALLAFSLHSLGLYFSAKRWKLILDEKGGGFSFWQLIQSLLVGTFFNHFLPTRFGGDVVRIRDTRHIEQGLTASLAVVVYERMSGIVALLLMAMFSSFLKIGFIKELPLLYVSLLVSMAGIAVLWLAWKILPRGFLAGIGCRRPWLQNVLLKLDMFHGIILDFLQHKRLSQKVFGWAFILQLNVVVHYFFIGQALKMTRIPFLDYFFSIPILLFILSFPVSINGIGVRDFFLIKLFVYYGYPASYAIAFSMLDVAFNLLLGIVGGLIYIFRKK
ncbi:MAG: lysylphosphatidylglycerol synthase transmembrane domain-containing protein [Candidatus Aminicenantes bacterium]|nr:lysylphosphatidylglycerol synthase transmembrane domain-containing protein [Candidatus Aminicenantes bacterium]